MSSSGHIREQRSSPRKLRSVIKSALTLVTVVFTATVATYAQSPTPSPAEVRTLRPNEVVNRRIEFGQTQVYELALEQHQFAQITVEQRGRDLAVTATGPDNFSLYIDNPNGFVGPETVSLLAPITGKYRIEIRMPNPYPAAEYELRVTGPREANELDQARIAAERVFADAQKLRRRGVFPQASEKFNEAIELWRKVGDLQHQGYAFTNLGRVQLPTQEFASALQSFTQAETLLKQAGDLSGQAFVLNEAAGAQNRFGDLREATVLHQKALNIRLELGDHYGAALTYNNLGLTYSLMGYQPQALEFYAKALAIWREHNVRHHEMRAVVNAAKARAEMGDVEAARLQFQAVLDYCNTELQKEKSPLAANARELKPFALNGLGLVYDTLADADSALTYYQEAITLFRESSKSNEADVLDNLGLAYAFLGDTTEAIQQFQQALAIREIIKEPRPWGVTLSNLGYAYTLLGDYTEAQNQLTLALPLNAQARDRRFEAYTLVRLGMTYVAMPAPEPLKALEYYEQALAIQQEPGFEDRRGQAITLDKIAEALALSGEETAAIKKYEEAIRLWTAVGDKQGQALSLFGIARIERSRLNLANARDRIEEAIAIVEQQRTTVTNRQLQMTYFAGKQDLYALAIDIRLQLYDLKDSTADLEATLTLSEKARARNLLDLLGEARVDLYKDMSPQLAERVRRLDRQISELSQNVVRFRGVDAKQDVASAQRILTARFNEYERLLAPFRRRAPRTRQALPLSAREIQELLDDDMMLLQFSLAEKRSHLWAVTKTRIEHIDLPGQAKIEDVANQLHQALRDREPQGVGESREEVDKRRQTSRARYRQNAAELSRLLLTDVAPKLGNKRLVIVPDGGLHYIPFEALPLPESVVSAQHASATAPRPLLLQNNEVIYQPSASVLATLRRTRRPLASKKIVILADPVFNSEEINSARVKDGSKRVQEAKARLTRSLRDIGDIGEGEYTLPRLEHSRTEANAIAAVAPRGSLKAVRFKASRALVTGPLLKRFGFVHFATHGLLNDKNPELSGIVLSMVNERGQPQDGYLTLRDIYNLDLPVQLVVVSACQTGVGKPVRGEGLIGLTRGFMNAGAQSVVVSLWRVEDEATAELMKRFYTHMFGRNSLSPAAALRQAKIEMKDEYDPYQWAGFVLQGDWK